MRLYHGSLNIIKDINLEIQNYKTDFGKGFYTTTDYKQARKWANIKRGRIEDNENIKMYVNVFEYEENNNLNILAFEDANKEWLDFIFMNRNSKELSHTYDIIKGPVADDRLYKVLVGYEDGVYDEEETIKRLKTYVLSNQISFHTLDSLECLKYIETIELGDEDE